MSTIKKLPVFKNEDEERNFWATHELTNYFDANKVKINPVFPNLKPSTKQLPYELLNHY